jgi:cytochrome c1
LLLATLLVSACSQPMPAPTYAVVGGDVDGGRQAIVDYGCGACHTIPGVTGADGVVGPPLTGWGKRASIAGEFPNTPEQLVAWIRDPQAMNPGSIMPDVGVTHESALDISAYLYSLQRSPVGAPWR